MEQDERIARVREMEAALNEAEAAVRALAAALQQYRVAPLKKLFDYYFGPLWLADHDADGRGGLPHDLPRGVLAQDTVYDLYSDHQTLLKSLWAVLQETEEKP